MKDFYNFFEFGPSNFKCEKRFFWNNKNDLKTKQNIQLLADSYKQNSDC